jgi:hypothetical protein
MKHFSISPRSDYNNNNLFDQDDQFRTCKLKIFRNKRSLKTRCKRLQENGEGVKKKERERESERGRTMYFLQPQSSLFAT